MTVDPLYSNRLCLFALGSDKVAQRVLKLMFCDVIDIFPYLQVVANYYEVIPIVVKPYE